MSKFAFFIFTVLLGWGVLIALMPNKFGFGTDTPTPRKIYEQPPIHFDRMKLDSVGDWVVKRGAVLHLEEEYFQVDCGDYTFISQPGRWTDDNHFHSNIGEIVGVYDKFALITTKKMKIKLWKTK